MAWGKLRWMQLIEGYSLSGIQQLRSATLLPTTNSVQESAKEYLFSSESFFCHNKKNNNQKMSKGGDSHRAAWGNNWRNVILQKGRQAAGWGSLGWRTRRWESRRDSGTNPQREDVTGILSSRTPSVISDADEGLKWRHLPRAPCSTNSVHSWESQKFIRQTHNINRLKSYLIAREGLKRCFFYR